jgi:hypothetical protein
MFNYTFATDWQYDGVMCLVLRYVKYNNVEFLN